MKKQDPYDFEEYIESSVTVDCQGDGCTKSHGQWCMDEIDFAKECIKKGWRIINDELLCPSCVKKLTKPIKNKATTR